MNLRQVSFHFDFQLPLELFILVQIYYFSQVSFIQELLHVNFSLPIRVVRSEEVFISHLELHFAYTIFYSKLETFIPNGIFLIFLNACTFLLSLELNYNIGVRLRHIILRLQIHRFQNWHFDNGLIGNSIFIITFI